MALRDVGFETVMVNCNPETVSTDYDTSDRLYFEPLTAEDVANVIDAEAVSGHRRSEDGRGPPCGRDRVARGSDTPEACAQPSTRTSYSGTSPCLDRPGRGSRAVERSLRASRHPSAERAAQLRTSTRHWQ